MAGISRFYKGAEFNNRVSYQIGNSANELPSRTSYVLREWCQPINFADGTSTNTEIFTFPNPCIVLSCSVNVRTAETTGATKTIDVGVTGAGNAFLSQCDVSSTGTKGVKNCLPFSITVTTSPFTFTAVRGGLVTVTGGTTSHITVTRGSTTTADLATTTPFSVYLSDGDKINVTYTGTPTMYQFQSQDPSYYFGAGGVALTWKPGSTDFATLDADVSVVYLAQDDLTVFQNTNLAMGPSD